MESSLFYYMADNLISFFALDPRASINFATIWTCWFLLRSHQDLITNFY